MRISTSLNIFWEVGVEIQNAMERCAKAGFEALDFNLTDYQRMEYPPFLDSKGEEWAAHISRTAESFGLAFTQMHAPIFPKFSVGKETERYTTMSHDSLRIAGVMGIPWVVWEPDVTPGDYGEKHRKEVFQKNQEFFDPLVKIAERYNTGVCLENVPDSMGKSRGCPKWVSSEAIELCELVDSFNSPRVGICWDTGHAHMQGLEQRKELRILGDRLKVLHIQDNNGQADQHLLPFMGTVNWKDVMDGLYDINYAGDFTYEVHNAIWHLPDTLKDPMMRYAVELGKILVQRNF